jgi:hypothetical protein
MVIQFLEHGHTLIKLAHTLLQKSTFEETTQESSPPVSCLSTNTTIVEQKIQDFPPIIGVFYCILGGLAASDTLLLTKSG